MQSADQEGEQGLRSWDLSVFRYPRPEKFNKTTVKGRVKFLELAFTDEDRKLFFFFSKCYCKSGLV